MGLAGSGLSRRSAAVVGEAIARAALTAERTVAVARTVFFRALLLRFFLVTDLSVARFVLTAVPLAISVLFSVWVLLRVKAPPRSDGLWVGSVLLDAGTAFLVLLANVLCPAQGYAGILRKA